MKNLFQKRLIIFTLLFTPMLFCNSAIAVQKPNIILILVDDMGWMDLACQGNKIVKTPNIDRLASQGMRFTAAYSASPVCSPTRASIMTGMAPARLKITNHISNRKFIPEGATLLPAETLNHLPLKYKTVAEYLKEAGYATAFMGKWHLAGNSKRGEKGRGIVTHYPEKQGFDLNLGGCAHGGPPTFFDPYRIHNLKPRRKGEYLPDRLADEALNYIRKHQKKPFFLAMWNYAVHWPMEAPEKYLAKYKNKKGPGLKDIRYGAMIEAMDRALGKIIAEVDRLNLSERTLIIFASDNGGYMGVADNRPLRMGKGYLYEGGIRVPMIVRWPKVIKKATTCDTPVISTDLFPTILAAAKIKPDANEPSDGRNLMPLLKQTGKLNRDAIFFHYPNYAWHRSNRLGSAIRSGHYKLIENFDDGSVELYDLKNDLSETKDLSKSMTKKTAELKKKLHLWRKETSAAMPVRIKK